MSIDILVQDAIIFLQGQARQTKQINQSPNHKQPGKPKAPTNLNQYTCDGIKAREEYSGRLFKGCYQLNRKRRSKACVQI